MLASEQLETLNNCKEFLFLQGPMASHPGTNRRDFRAWHDVSHLGDGHFHHFFADPLR
jgi:hypothetical protein